ncbi:hypothetical protein Y1Q_0024053 [Alligator mississippiensis]|uniref:Uncharacterized protein n=1 Tax=Alligator mississippiensis TaxID=8496 RepID=A0A151NHQ1_ALLMI|nr:hypothetical protein Y1Q_0024053 [Alligator mississippiensis]
MAKTTRRRRGPRIQEEQTEVSNCIQTPCSGTAGEEAEMEHEDFVMEGHGKTPPPGEENKQSLLNEMAFRDSVLV